MISTTFSPWPHHWDSVMLRQRVSLAVEMPLSVGCRSPVSRSGQYAAYLLSDGHIEELMQERGISVDHSTINRWATRFPPLLKTVAKQTRKVGTSWRTDEIHIKVEGLRNISAMLSTKKERLSISC
ncbi:hypothetical protein [Massilia sp. CFBP 13721]|uniref:hypothetical protein n=1 Tax=Massilia sp. CFBP 13721 TaxID=2775300 RepID=UPI001E2F0D18|nr:hypothetical protein [Massilia sp. CFBP 13721]